MKRKPKLDGAPAPLPKCAYEFPTLCQTVYWSAAYAIHCGYDAVAPHLVVGTEWSRRRFLQQFLVDQAAVDQGISPRVARARRLHAKHHPEERSDPT